MDMLNNDVIDEMYSFRLSPKGFDVTKHETLL